MSLRWDGDVWSVSLSLLLLAMSVASWSVILFKSWLLYRVQADVRPATAAFWQAPDLNQACITLASLDRHRILLPLAQALQPLRPGTLGAQGDTDEQRTRVLRDALHLALAKLQYGQVLLATVGSVGQPRDGNPQAMYALFDSAAALLTFHRVHYDHAAAADAIRRAGLPEFFATRLETGR